MGQSAPGCLGVVLRLIGIRAPGEPGDGGRDYDVYRVRDDFLSPAEASFYRVLRLAAGERFIICPKVRLGDLLFVAEGKSGQGARNRIDRKHLDFVLLNPETLRPVAALELDDSSHSRASAKASDEFKDRALAAVGLPLVRVPVRRSYELAEIRALLDREISPPSASEVQAEPARATLEPQCSSPACPKCGRAMQLRTAKRGENAGAQFWGCANFPQCRGVLSSPTAPAG